VPELLAAGREARALLAARGARPRGPEGPR
jgi:hypothetical protein